MKRTMLFIAAFVLFVCTAGFAHDAHAQANRGRIHPASDFMLNVARGVVPGRSHIAKFGMAGDIDSATNDVADVWDGATDTITGFDKTLSYTFSASANIDRISSSAADTVDIEIQGLDENWDLTVQTKTLTGTTPVALDTDLIRVFRMKNVGDTALSGDVFCFVDGTTNDVAGIPDTEADVRAIIQQGNEQTLMAIYTIPNDKSGFMTDLWGAIAKLQTQISPLNLYFRMNPTGVFQVKHNVVMSSAGASHIQHKFEVPLSGLPEKTDVVLRAESSVANGAVSAGFGILLVDD